MEAPGVNCFTGSSVNEVKCTVSWPLKARKLNTNQKQVVQV